MSTVGIKIQKNGNLLEANVKINKKSIMLEKKKLYTHYVSESSNLSIHSTYKIEEILIKDIELLNVQLPPPLNTYIYPYDIIILKGTNTDTFQSISINELLLIFDDMKENIKNMNENMAVYDVAIENDDDVEELSEDEEEEDQEDYEESEDNENDIDEEDWDDEDDITNN